MTDFNTKFRMTQEHHNFLGLGTKLALHTEYISAIACMSVASRLYAMVNVQLVLNDAHMAMYSGTFV